jgi:hypothetical protein
MYIYKSVVVNKHSVITSVHFILRKPEAKNGYFAVTVFVVYLTIHLML